MRSLGRFVISVSLQLAPSDRTELSVGRLCAKEIVCMLLWPTPRRASRRKIRISDYDRGIRCKFMFFVDGVLSDPAFFFYR